MAKVYTKGKDGSVDAMIETDDAVTIVNKFIRANEEAKKVNYQAKIATIDLLLTEMTNLGL